MIDYKRLEDEQDFQKYEALLAARGADSQQAAELRDLNRKRKETILKAESLKAEQNKVGQEIAALKKQKKDASDLISQMQHLSQDAKKWAAEAQGMEEQIRNLALCLPNWCHETTPVGASESENRQERQVGEIPQFAFDPKEHFQLGERRDQIDFDRAAKVTGARFAFLRNEVARLSRALSQFMLDHHTTVNGYEEILPPFMVHADSMVGTGQLPKFKEDAFHIEETDYYLAPTAEVPVTNYFRSEILSEEQLPVSFVAYSPCFRAEAGSYGKDTKGLIRQHQFEKVELLKFVHPDESYEEHEKLTAHAEAILQKLELPYRVMALCTGDIGFAAAKCYDLEVWLPGQKTFREISSCSNFEDFQARRANIRFRPKGGKPQFVHTLNGSGLAVGRTLIAVMENYQNEDGSVRVPEVLLPYMNGNKEILRA